MGCFWGVESLYGIQKGVLRTCVGYTGGKTTDPSYHDLENHTEVVKIEYDPTVIDYGSELTSNSLACLIQCSNNLRTPGILAQKPL